MTEELLRGNMDGMWIVPDEVYFRIRISLRFFSRKTNQSMHMEITSCELFKYKACVSQLRIFKNFKTSWIESWSTKNAPTS